MDSRRLKNRRKVTTTREDRPSNEVPRQFTKNRKIGAVNKGQAVLLFGQWTDSPMFWTVDRRGLTFTDGRTDRRRTDRPTDDRLTNG